MLDVSSGAAWRFFVPLPPLACDSHACAVRTLEAATHAGAPPSSAISRALTTGLIVVALQVQVDIEGRSP